MFSGALARGPHRLTTDIRLSVAHDCSRNCVLRQPLQCGVAHDEVEVHLCLLAIPRPRPDCPHGVGIHGGRRVPRH